MVKVKWDETPWNIVDVGKATVVLIIMVMLSSMFKLLFSSENPLYAPQPILVAFVLFFVYAILLLVSWLFTVKKYKVPFERLGLTSFDLWDGFRDAFFWFIVIEVFMITYALLAPLFIHFEPPVEPLPKLFGTSRLGVGMAVFIIAFVAPFVEEIFFRGFIYSALRKRLGMKMSIFINATIFAILHASIWKIAPILLIGAVLAYLYEKERSLGPPIILHCMNNLFALSLIYILPKYIPQLGG